MNNSASTPKIVRNGEGYCLELGAEARRQILSDYDTGTALSLFRSRFHFGSGVPFQMHTREDQWFWIEHGEFDFHIASQGFSLAAYDFIYIPSCTPYSFTCTAESGDLLLGAIGVDSGHLFRELAAQLEDNSLLDHVQIQELAVKHGVLFENFDSVSAPASTPQIVRSHEGQCLEAFGDKGRFVISSEQTRNRFCVGAGETSPLSGPPIHIHGREDELFCILAGHYEFQIGDARLQAEAGDVVWAPCGIPHTFRVVSTAPGHCLTLFTPGGFDEFLHTCFELFQKGEATPPAIAEIGLSHQIRFLLPTA